MIIMIMNSITHLGPDHGALTEGAKFIVNIWIVKNQKKRKGLQRVIRGQIVLFHDPKARYINFGM